VTPGKQGAVESRFDSVIIPTDNRQEMLEGKQHPEGRFRDHRRR